MDQATRGMGAGAGGLPAAPACPVCGSRTDVASVGRVHESEAARAGPGSPVNGSLAALLAPPVYPRTRRGVWIPILFVGWFIGLMTLMFLSFVPQSLDVVLNWRLLAWTEWWRALTWATWGFGLVGLLLAVLYIKTPRTRRDSLALWEAAYYCRLDDLVFIPGYPYSASPTIFHRLIREQPQQWLLRGQ
jgi:hypothetical protein